MDSRIGRKVWHYGKNGVDTNKVYTITAEHKDKDGFVESYTIKAEDGVVIEKVDYYYVVFCPKTDIENETAMVSTYLSDNGIYADDVSVQDSSYDKGKEAFVSISWGDWKHDHQWCDCLMSYIGFDLNNEVETEEDGSDCYSADHYYYKAE